MDVSSIPQRGDAVEKVVGKSFSHWIPSKRTKRRMARAFLPLVTLIVVPLSFFRFLRLPKETLSLLIRLLCSLIMSLRMEYVTRTLHRDFWHSRALWWIHATHHHQQVPIGSSPSSARKINTLDFLYTVHGCTPPFRSCCSRAPTMY